MDRDYSLRLRLVAAMSFMFLLGVAGSAVYYYAEAYRVGDRVQERTLQSQARELLGALDDAVPGEVVLDLTPPVDALYEDRSSNFFFTLYDREGRVLLFSPNLDAPLPAVAIEGNDGFAPLRFVGSGASQVAVISVVSPAGNVLVVGRGEPDGDALAFSLIEEGAEGLWIVLVPFALASLGIIWAITHWSLRPVARTSRMAMAIGPSNPSARIATDERLPAEIRPLVDAANAAVDRLANAYTAERRLTADAAHELRTPLAVLNLRLQQARIRNLVDWPTVEREIATLNRLVDQLLDLARKESPAHAKPHTDGVPINLSRTAREAAAVVLPIAERSGRSIEIEEGAEPTVRGFPDELRDMFRNLLDNALTHGKGIVRIRIAEDPQLPGFCLVDIRDDGDVELDDGLFGRFRKGHPGSPGAGLGLAIVRQVARNHGGDAMITPDRRSSLRLKLPLL